MIMGLSLSGPSLKTPVPSKGMGKGDGGDEGTGVTAPYTDLRLSLDCYPIPYSSISHCILRNSGYHAYGYAKLGAEDRVEAKNFA